MDFPIIDEGLCIRPFEDRDVAAFVDAVHESAPTVGMWMPWCRPDYAATDAQSWFQACLDNLLAGRAHDVGIFAADGIALYGGIAINQINVEHNFGNIGYWVRQSRQGTGIATRAVALISRYGFDKLKLTRLEIVAATENRASRRVAEKSGAVFECVARNRLVTHGRAVPAAVYSIVPKQLA